MGSVLVLALGIFSGIAHADTIGPITFSTSTYTLGSINGQNGWMATGAYDVAVASTSAFGSPVGFGAQALRISDGITSGSFGDWVFAPPLADAVGEASATAGTFSPGTLQRHFDIAFDIVSTQATEQPGLHVSMSPDRGDGSRMSYLRFEDATSGINVYFDDVQGTSSPANFVETQIASGLSRTTPHHIELSLDTLNGPSNDVVKVWIDGVLVHTGTSWEDYYRYDLEASAEQSPRIVKTIILQARGTADPANLGKGFLFDNFAYNSGPIPIPPPTTVTVTIDKFIDGMRATTTTASSAAFPMTATWNAANIGSGTGSYTLSPSGYNSPNPYEAVTAAMTAGASYTTSEVTGGSVVGADCSAGKPYMLAGYSTGATLAAAASGTVTATAPSFTNLTADQFIVVHNRPCLPAPIPSYPADGTVTTPSGLASIGWNPVTDPIGGITYVYQSSHSSSTNPDGSFVSPIYTSGALATTSIATAGTPAGVYYWHVQAKDADGNISPWSSAWSVTVSTSPMLTITMPAVDGTYVTGTYAFAATYQNGVTTSLAWAVRMDPLCNTNTVAGNVDGYSNTSTLSGTAFSAVLDTTGWADGAYCFVVNDLHGLRKTRLFTVDNLPPTAPALVSPADGATVNGANVTQVWSDSDLSIDHFVYESFNDASATSLRWQQTFSSTTFSKVAVNVADSIYWWRVKAVDAIGNTSMSPLWKLIIDNTPPPVVYVTTDPATGITTNDATLNGTNVALAASGHSFWVSTSTFSTASPTIPSGVYSTPDLGSITASTTFSVPLSSLETNAVVHGQISGTMPAVTPNTTYYYVAWSFVGGTWRPGAMQTVMTDALHSDATLSALGVSAGVLSPSFDPDTTAYADVLPHETTIPPQVTATTTDPLATMVITQATTTSGTATVHVTAQDGVTTQDYTVAFSLAPATSSMVNVVVLVDNTDGGTATSSDFTVTVLAGHPDTATFPGDPAGTSVMIDPNVNFNVNVSHLPHYDQTTSGDCHDPSGLPAGNSATCTVTETYRAPHDDGHHDSVGVGWGVFAGNGGEGNSGNGSGGHVLGESIGGNAALQQQIADLQARLLALLQQYLALLHSRTGH